MLKNDTVPCSFEGCWNTRDYKITSLCQAHQKQYRRGENLRPLRSWGPHGDRRECSASECSSFARTRGLCKAHYMRFLRTGKVFGPGTVERHCIFSGCNRAVDVRGYCEHHYKKVRDSGEAPWSNTRMIPCRVNLCEREGQYGMCNKHSQRAARFGLTWDELSDLMSSGACDACGFEGPDLHIHHDHSCCPKAGNSCGRCVVAYLCGGCNTAAGMVGDDPERLKALSEVIRQGPRFSRD